MIIDKYIEYELPFTKPGEGTIIDKILVSKQGVTGSVTAYLVQNKDRILTIVHPRYIKTIK